VYRFLSPPDLLYCFAAGFLPDIRNRFGPIKMFQEVKDADFVRGEHSVLKFWQDNSIFRKLREQNGPERRKTDYKRWSFLDGPITANNPMGVHHAWGRTYKDTYQRFFAMMGYDQRYQNGFDCQGLWVEVEVEKQLGLGTKTAVNEYGIDNFVNKCKSRVLQFAARQTEQSVRLGYWMDWDDPDQLRLLAAHLDPENKACDENEDVEFTTPAKTKVSGKAREISEKLGNPEWGGSYFTFSTENNETIWTFLKKCFERTSERTGRLIYRGHDVMPWSGRSGSAYSQMEIAEGRKLKTHKAVFVGFLLRGDRATLAPEQVRSLIDSERNLPKEYLLVWTTTPWTLTSNVAVMVNPDLEYVAIRSKRDDAIYYFAKDNLNCKRHEREFKEGFGRPEWSWPDDVPKLKTIAQIFKEQGGFEELDTIKGDELLYWEYEGPFDDLPSQQRRIVDWGTDHHTAETILRRWLPQLKNEDDPWASDWKDVFEKLLSWLDSFFSPPSIAVRQEHLKNLLPSLSTKLQQLGLYAAYSALNSCAGDSFSRDQVAALWETVCEDLKKVGNQPCVKSHRVLDGGRDNKGKAIVLAGEGTGLVHSAPGCGDVDHKMGLEYGLPSIAPLKEDGTYDDGFGEFTVRVWKANSDEVRNFVFEKLRDNHRLVYKEDYPHIYPHCWRTGDELVFRLVDEWFINMDWREEIKDVTRKIEWLPDSINGQERECEWLSNMSDWMISKKRFWGLALPIWVDQETGDFEVMGAVYKREGDGGISLEERVESDIVALKAAEQHDDAATVEKGWAAFEGHTPHRPWIDGVKIQNPKTGNVMTRIEDVGNPWLDAGIVPFSTMHYNHDHDDWQKWYPADLVTECFPGQFRNWFYSMLSLSTMMRYDETDDPIEKRPFKTLLGHRLVLNEVGQPMHKSDGTAIWFEEAAEQIGVDTMRWMYLAQNPAADLRFGTRHPDEHVTLASPEGPQSETREGVPCCKVTSQPADETRRSVMIPLWNSYAFFVNYARLDEFDPTAESIPVADRPEIDRWILSNLQSVLHVAEEEMPKYNVAGFCKAAEDFLDDLTNWYIRRNRRRFWRSKDASDTDKTAAYQTLYEVLVTLCKALAPLIPFMSERMYQNLVAGLGDNSVPSSVHLCEYPLPTLVRKKANYDNFTSGQIFRRENTPDLVSHIGAVLDEELNRRTAIAQLVVKLGHKLREAKTLRVRLPLAEMKFACATATQREAVEHLGDVIKEELNIKQITSADNLDDLVSYSFKPNLKTLGPRYGKLLGVIRKELPELDPAILAPLRSGGSVTVELGGEQIELGPKDVMVSTEQASDWSCADEDGIQIAISTVTTPELEREGMARDFVRQVQQLRKEHDLQIQDRITVQFQSDDAEIATAVTEWSDYIQNETLADSVEAGTAGADVKPVSIGNAKAQIWIARV
jgi:isoleucyl-tRNA synthetase